MTVVVVAAAALAFTIASFWWQQVRRGKLVAAAPMSYGISAGGTTVLLLRLPLALYNTGASGLIVAGLRCWFPRSSQALELPWRGTHRGVHRTSDDPLTTPSPFVVGGRQAVPVIIEFGGPFPSFQLEAGTHEVLVQVAVAEHSRWSKQHWRQLVKFELDVSERVLDGSYHVGATNTRLDPMAAERTTNAAMALLAKLRRAADTTP